MKTAKEKLADIAAIYEEKRVDPTTSGITVSTHARHNLEGAIFDLERTGKADDICIRTLKRVSKQLADIEKILKS